MTATVPPTGTRSRPRPTSPGGVPSGGPPSVTVMSHPARGDRARLLAARLAVLQPALSFEIDPVRTTLLGSAAAAWRPGAASHHALLQDDAVPVPQLPELLTVLVDGYPDSVLSLFCEWGCKTASAARIGALAGFGAVEVVDRYVPTNAVVAPRAVAAALAAEFDRRADAPPPEVPEPDDVVVREVTDRIGVQVLLPLPNLTQDAGLPSTVGNDPMGSRFAVCAVPGPAATRAPTALTGLTAVPFLPWRSGEPVLLTRSSGETEWRRGPLGPHAAHLGLDACTLDELAATAARCAVFPPHPELSRWQRAVAQVLAATTMCAATVANLDRGRLADPLVRAALDTAVPGALRCLLPSTATPRGAAAAAPFVHSVVAGTLDLLESGRVEPLPCTTGAP